MGVTDSAPTPPPTPDDRSPAVPEKRVGWAELFFDLVFVFAVTTVSALIEDDHSWAGLLRALIVFVPLYWMWVGAAVRTNQQDAEHPSVRLTLFAIALASIFMAVAVPDVYGDLGLMFAIAYWAGRIVLGVPLLRPANRGAWLPINPVTVSIAVTGPVLVVGALFDGPVRVAIWAAAAAIDLGTPTLLRSRLRGMHFDAPHLAERFGLFVLIALGESVVAIGISAQGHLGVATGVAIAAAFALSCGLWWVYFHFAANAVRHALQSAAVQMDITRLVLSYGHLMFIAGIVLVSVGLHEAVAEPGHHLGWAGAGLLYGGAALFLSAFGFTRWTMFRLVSRTRLGTAAVVLLLLPVAPFVPALVALVLLALVVAGLNVIELRINDREGWRARLSA